MNEQLPDRTVIIIILSTLLLVLITIFSFSTNKSQENQLIEWKDSNITSTIVLAI